MFDRNATVRHLSASSPEVREVLRWYGIHDSEFTLDDACRAVDLDPEDVWADLEATTTDSDDFDYDDDDDDPAWADRW